MRASPTSRTPPAGLGFDRSALFGTSPTAASGFASDFLESSGKRSPGKASGVTGRVGRSSGHGGDGTKPSSPGYAEEEVTAEQQDIMLQIKAKDQHLVRTHLRKSSVYDGYLE